MSGVETLVSGGEDGELDKERRVKGKEMERKGRQEAVGWVRW